MLEIALRARAWDAIPRTVYKIAPRVHRSRFGRVRDLGLYDGVLEMTSRARTRSAIMSTVLEMAPRARARDAIPRTFHKIALRAHLIQHLPIQ